MTLQTPRFGTLEFESEDVITFDDGLIGFPEARQFVLLNHKPDSPFRWLQSVDDPALAFLVATPESFVPDYAPEISQDQADRLQLKESTPTIVFTTVAIPAGKPEEMTINLAGPLIVNADARKARQIVLEDSAYTVKHRVFHRENADSEPVAA